MTVIVSHPTGNANVRAVLRGFEQGGILDSFQTTLALPGGAWSQWLESEALSRRLGQRRFPEIPRDRVRVHPCREIVRLMARRAGIEALIRHETGWASVDAVYRSLDRSVARRLRRTKETGVRAVYAYEDGALETFRAAGDRGIKRLYDLPIPYWRTVRDFLAEEADRLPEWSSTMPGLIDSVVKHERKDEELMLAEHIYVASTFARQSLVDYFGTRLNISVAPYGCPAPLVDGPVERPEGEPLRIFFAGRLSQSKGLADLIEALSKLEISWQLTLAGSFVGSVPDTLTKLLQDTRCKWLGVVPHSTLLEEMSKAHVFAFPTIFEGFGMVITEAMACGLPVITTPNSAGPDILTEGRDGFVVPIRDPDALADRITQLAEDEALRKDMAGNALSTARRMSWNLYEQLIVELVNKEIGV